MVFPNPFTNEFVIVSPDDDQIEIYNVTGVLVSRHKINAGETRIESNHLDNGVYFVHSALKGQVIKIIKQ